MSHSRKKYRVAPSQSSIDDNLSTTSKGSSSTLPPHLRDRSAVTSIPPMKNSAYPNLPDRGRPSQTVDLSGATQGNAHNDTSTVTASVGNQPVSAGTQSPKTNYASERPFACTFSGCVKIFKTKKDLVKHKIADEEGHDYCKVCDLDFQNDESLHLHKVASEKHICCPICSEDFKSEGGRDRHCTQMHAAEQNINCRGCGKHFAKGAALLSHIEKNQCPGIQDLDFETQRALIANDMQIESNKESDEFGILSLRPTTIADSSVGGVPIADSILDNEETPDELNANMPTLSRILSNGSSATSSASVARSKAYQNSYPALGSDAKGKGKGKENGKSKIDPTATDADQPVAESWAKRHFPNAPNTPAPADWTPNTSSESGYADTVDAADGKVGHFRIADLKPDSTDGKYHCPFLNCLEPTYATFELISNHLTCGYHMGFENRCVGCLRLFKSPSALTAHMESTSARCSVRDSRQFGNALSLVSGGFLGVNGRHADGSVKIDAPEKPVSFRVNW